MKKCLLALALLFAVLLSGCAIVQTTDLADYGNTGGETWHGSAVFDLLSNLTSTGDADGTQSAAPPRMQELFPIFPPDALSIPPSMLRMVVFPAPLAPTMTQNSPFSISKLTSSTALISTSPIW